MMDADADAQQLRGFPPPDGQQIAILRGWAPGHTYILWKLPEPTYSYSTFSKVQI